MKATCSICGRKDAIDIGDDGNYCLCVNCVQEEIEMRNYYQKRCARLVEVVRNLAELLNEY